MSWIREGELNLLERFSANVLKVRVIFISPYITFVHAYCRFITMEMMSSTGHSKQLFRKL